MDESFEHEIWHTYYQHKYDFMKKISWKKKVSNLWEGGKDGSSEIFYMLVNFEYLFLGKSFGPKFGKYVISLEMILHKKFHD